MPPGGGGGGEGGGGEGGEGCEHGSTVHGHPPATIRRDEDAPPHSTPPLPFVIPAASEEMKQKQEQVQEPEQQPAPSLPEGALVEILSRVPYRSLCRFKCVSKPWFALCSAPDIRKRSPQTLSGFFYYQGKPLCFRNLNGRGPPLVDPSLPFLRQSYESVNVQQFCDGLLLCICWNSCSAGEGDYVVCNPATQEWTVLPPLVFSKPPFTHYLGFEAAVPSRFLVFATPNNDGYFSGEMAIYSSQTGQWTYVQSKWAIGTPVFHSEPVHVFFNGTMHLITLCKSIFTVDADGKVWREIQMPDELSFDEFSIGQSQGCLYAWWTDYHHDCQLYIWVLEDYGTGKWTLKHTVNILELFGRNCLEDGDSYEMFAVHPDCNVIFLTDRENMTLSYNMDNQKMHVICTEFMYGLPYIPCFAELPSGGH